MILLKELNINIKSSDSIEEDVNDLIFKDLSYQVKQEQKEKDEHNEEKNDEIYEEEEDDLDGKYTIQWKSFLTLVKNKQLKTNI